MFMRLSEDLTFMRMAKEGGRVTFMRVIKGGRVIFTRVTELGRRVTS